MEPKNTEFIHWADKKANEIIETRGDKELYIVESGITPSGTIHIGNFREPMTVELVKRALESKGKKVRYLYVWDDFDRFRKVPKNLPKQDLLKPLIGKPVCSIMDPFECHNTYAEHFEKEFEAELTKVGINPEFVYQNKRWKSFYYVEETKIALENTKEIKRILDQFRKEPLAHHWLPVEVYCEKCNHECEAEDVTYTGGYKLFYKCKNCSNEDEFDFREKPIVKLRWRTDWAMRWHKEKVDFEPAGKEHSTPGGSRDTGVLIQENVYKTKAPVYLFYDFIIVKGVGGKMSGSKGNVMSLKDVLMFYEPEIIRYLFASTRPRSEFAISFDLDVIKVYEDFDKCERIYFNKEEIDNTKELQKQKRTYELSCVDKIPAKKPFRPLFRHISNVLQINNLDQEKTFEKLKQEIPEDEILDEQVLKTRISCVKNWVEMQAPEEFKFEIQKDASKIELTEDQKTLFSKIKQNLINNDYDEKELHNLFYELCKENNVQIRDFFKSAYKILINKQRGPKLASFIITVGKEKIIKLLETIN